MTGVLPPSLRTRSNRPSGVQARADVETAAAPTRRRAPGTRAWRSIAGVAFVVAVVALAAQMTGQAPKAAAPAKGATATAPPPLVLRDGVPAGSLLARGARALQAGDAGLARQAFAAAATQAPRAVEPQVGTALTAWSASADGPDRVVARLTQLRAANPSSPYVTLHLGIAQLANGAGATANTTLGAALVQARRAGAFDLARRADDLLHPSLAPGYPPLVAPPARAVPTAALLPLAKLQRAVVAGDRVAAVRDAARLLAVARSAGDRGLQAVALTGGFDKQQPQSAVRQLVALQSAAPHDVRVALHLALVQLWTGERVAGIATLRGIRPAPGAAADVVQQAQVLLKALSAPAPAATR